MLKLIGLIVVFAVLFWGYDSIHKWYVGDATPQETVGEVRKVLGEKISGTEKAPQSAPREPVTPPQPEQDSQKADKPLDTNEMLKKMMKE